MSTSALSAPARRARPIALAHVGASHLAGLLLFSGGALLFMTIITAEALYPAAYSTGGNEISDLGSTREGLVLQPSATIFNVGMMLSGLSVAVGSLFVHRSTGRWSVSLPIAVLGLSALTVGIFPGNTGTPHALAAMIAFISGGIAAVSASRVADAPFRYALALLGLMNLVSLAAYFTLGDANPFWALGVGGAERWVAYPIILWLMGFGGYLAGRAGEARPQPTT